MNDNKYNFHWLLTLFILGGNSMMYGMGNLMEKPYPEFKKRLEKVKKSRIEKLLIAHERNEKLTQEEYMFLDNELSKICFEEYNEEQKSKINNNES